MEVSHVNPPTTVERGRIRLLFLDGLRGLSALYVTLFHAHWLMDWDLRPAPLSGAASWASALLGYGHFAVAVFIVLSGYCLMLPVTRSASLSIPGGIQQYLFRRARRILPPYYIALGASLVLIAVVPALRDPGGEHWADALPALTFGPVVSHFLMVHCFFPQWAQKINPPMWSVAVEWWIYFLFPTVLLPVWRRFGMYGAVGLAALVGAGLHGLFKQRADSFCPWYFTLFAFGAAGAFINFSPAAVRERAWPWAWFAALGCGAAVGLLAIAPGWSWSRTWISDVVVGAGVAALTVWCGEAAQNATRSNFVLRVLESRMVLWLGTISYSLYLVHNPILAMLSPSIRALGLGPELSFTVATVGGTAASLLLAHGFHRLFERPFMVGHPKTLVKTAVSAAVEPAP